ncbi:hypothetical protein HN51_003185 [Arachis hypogaea]|uniref:Peptidase S54 rhomboid domain-containing protein n=2 Tax=Arachis TaxID=3817 RepID=A0A445EJZ1_ARAHY|nr:RHOMBOID-like protein 12, mitochondrial [Arachis duranensis]XP_025617101.1 RHOMBOID-like protein 12, mitochondrial [Arachis hypogaea]QHO51520.1 RHOMBOID-like protein [Arachis hypogaea]RYR75653.1 hypothetical protein Ahy_A01g000227 [Arachis hypogaea]
MQSFLCKLVANHSHRHHHNLSGTLHRNILHSLSKPPLSSQPQQQLVLQLRNRIPTTSFFATLPLHHSHSCRSFLTQIRGFLSNPLLASNFRRFSNRNQLLNFRSKLPTPQFHRRSFGFNQSPDLYRGWRSWFNRLTPNDMVLGLIIANVAVFLLWRIGDKKFMINNFTISLDNFKSGRFHTLITNAFSHIEFGHLFSNMIGLYFFGLNVAGNFGPAYLLKLYLTGAVGGSIFYLVHKAYKSQTSKDWGFMKHSRDIALGASAAVNAIVLLDIFLFPKATIYLNFLIPVPAILLGALYIGKDMLIMFQGDSYVAGSAHLGGAVVAAIAWARIRKGIF